MSNVLFRYDKLLTCTRLSNTCLCSKHEPINITCTYTNSITKTLNSRAPRLEASTNALYVVYSSLVHTRAVRYTAVRHVKQTSFCICKHQASCLLLLGKLSRWQTDDFFLLFSQKTGSDLSGKFAKVQSLFSRKNNKNISKCHLLKLLPCNLIILN